MNTKTKKDYSDSKIDRIDRIIQRKKRATKQMSKENEFGSVNKKRLRQNDLY